ncbi:MAG: DUF2804 domain-containing protein [Bacilli bacterium]
MQNEILKVDDLLNEDGSLKHKGYAKKLLLKYDRNKIKAPKWRIKEWDYYLVYNNDFAIAFTISDNSYMALDSLTLIDFKKAKEHTNSPMRFFTNGKTNFPSTSKIGDVVSLNKKVHFSFKNDGNKRILEVNFPNFMKGITCNVYCELTEEPQDSMVIATPFFKNKKAFYYNQKIVGFKANGYIEYDNQKYEFTSSNTRGILDWGRGVWTYKNTWYWGAGAFIQDNHEIGFNIGYGFGDTSNASENMIFFDGKAHKLDQVTFNIPIDKKGKESYLEPWTFTSNDNRFVMTFKPIIDRHADTDLKILCSLQHQVFGVFNGTMILDDGTQVKIVNQIGFAEKVFNKW